MELTASSHLVFECPSFLRCLDILSQLRIAYGSHQFSLAYMLRVLEWYYTPLPHFLCIARLFAKLFRYNIRMLEY